MSIKAKKNDKYDYCVIENGKPLYIIGNKEEIDLNDECIIYDEVNLRLCEKDGKRL